MNKEEQLKKEWEEAESNYFCTQIKEGDIYKELGNIYAKARDKYFGYILQEDIISLVSKKFKESEIKLINKYYSNEEEYSNIKDELPYDSYIYTAMDIGKDNWTKVLSIVSIQQVKSINIM